MIVPLLLAAILAFGDPISDWESLKPEDGRYTARMPPGSVETRQRSGPGDAAPEVVIRQSSSGKSAYLITYTDVPARSARAPRVLLDGTRDLVVKSSKGRLLSETRIELGTSPGREIRAEVPLGDDPKGGVLSCRIYLVGRRVFQVMTIGPADEMDSEANRAFLESFRPLVPGVTTPKDGATASP